MNKQQKTYTAFIESLCNKFNCPEMAPALKEGFQAFCEAISDTDIMQSDAKAKLDQLCREIIREGNENPEINKEGRHITDELRKFLSEGKYIGRIAYILDDPKRIVELMNSVGIQATYGRAPRAYYIDYSFQDKETEMRNDTQLIEKLDSLKMEMGTDVPGLDSIISNIQTGHDHWSRGSAGIVLGNNEYRENEDTYKKFFRVANRNGFTASISPCRIGQLLEISW